MAIPSVTPWEEGDGAWEDTVAGLGDLPQVALGTWYVNMEKIKERQEEGAKTGQ